MTLTISKYLLSKNLPIYTNPLLPTGSTGSATGPYATSFIPFCMGSGEGSSRAGNSEAGTSNGMEERGCSFICSDNEREGEKEGEGERKRGRG